MDAGTFDALTRDLLEVSPRRRLVQLLADGAVAALLPWPEAEAESRRRCRRSRRCGDRCCRRGDICADRRRGTCVTGQGRCPLGADVCVAQQGAICDLEQGCFCFTSRDLSTRCGQFVEDETCTLPCQADADCTSLGAAAFCAVKGPGCCFAIPEGGGFCVRPWPK